VPYVGYFPDSTNYASLPTISYVIPNMTNDMHDGSYPTNITIGDTWFHNHLNSLLPWALNNNTLFILIFDEDDDFHGNNVATIFYGPMVQGGTYTRKITFCNILRTLEDMYGLGHAGCAADSSVINWCWNTTTGTQNIASVKSSVTVTPNPANNFVTFAGNSIDLTNASLIITDAFGRQMNHSVLANNELQLNTIAYPQGMYFYKIIHSNQSVVEGKFIIRHN